MTQQERNEQIALMLGWIKKGNLYAPSVNDFFVEELTFHSDWNWIMKSLIHITNLGWNWELIDFNGTIKEKDCFSCSIFNLDLSKQYNKIKNESSNPIEVVFKTVSDFAKRYNNKEL